VSAVWSTVTAALVTGGSAIAGGLVVAGSNYAISRTQSKGAQIGDLRQALTALLSVLGQVDTELRSEPRTKRTVRFVNEQVEHRFPQVDYITGRLHRRIFQPHLDGLVARFHDAMADNRRRDGEPCCSKRRVVDGLGSGSRRSRGCFAPGAWP
jgi:hypothetical protein